MKVKDGLVVNASELRCYWKEWRRRDNLIRRGMFRDLEQASTHESAVPGIEDETQAQKASAKMNYSNL